MDPFLESFLINISSGPVKLAQVSILISQAREAILHFLQASSAIIVRAQISWLEGLWNSHCKTAVGISGN